ncbi:hypothetical protein CR513_39838, partial [Mucuna pruriens]
MFVYMSRSKSKAMESRIEALELQNQDLKGEIPSQTNAPITAMANYGATGHTQAGSTAGPLPHTAEAQRQASRTTQPLVAHKQTLMTEDKWQSLEEQLRAMEGGNQSGPEAMDLCLVPDVDLPTDFKTLEFDKHKGSSYLRAHLVMYYRNMAAYVYDNEILVHYFQDSLTGVASDDRSQLQSMVKREQEGFKEYA